MLRSALLNVMIKAARKASRTLKRDFGEIEHLQASLKGPANFVTAADLRAEEILRDELEHARPGYGFLGEEGGTREGSDKTHRWIVDPLDGTLNFLHGIPHFAISIGLEREDDHAIEDGIGEKRDPDLLIEHDHDQGADGEEHHHPDDKNPGRGELKWIDLLRHGQRPYLDSQ